MSVLRIIGIPPKTTEPTTYRLKRQAVRAYPVTGLAPRKTINHLRRQWIAKIEYLGSKWLLHPANSVQKRMLGRITPDAAVCLTTVACATVALFLEVAP
jgi:hypothetical protein